MSKMKQIILRVMDTYKHMPCLWEKTHKDYKNKNIRNEAQIALLEVYKEFDPNATVKIMTKKIQNFRTGYMKELKKVKESVYKAEPYVPTLWYYDALSFLEDVVTSESFPPEPEAIETEYLWSASEEDSELDGQSSSAPPVKRKKISKTDFVHYENAPEQKMDHENVAGRKMKDEEWEIIGKSIGLQLRDLETRQLTIAQKIISDTIYYGKMGMLCQKSCMALQSDVNATEVPYHFVTISDSEQCPHSVSSSTPKSCKTHIFSPQIPPQPLDPLVRSESSPII